jgi:hypothetical protein
LIGSAQLRRGIALHLLGRYGDAGFCFKAAEKRCGEKEKNMLGMWKKKLEMALEKVDEDDVSREVTIEEIPQVEIPKAEEKITELAADKSKETTKETGTSTKQTSVTTTVTAPPPPPGVITPASKIRHEWYQTSTHVVLSLYVKGVPKDKASIEVKSKTVSSSLQICKMDYLPTLINGVSSQSRSLSLLATTLFSILTLSLTTSCLPNPPLLSYLPKSKSNFRKPVPERNGLILKELTKKPQLRSPKLRLSLCIRHLLRPEVKTGTNSLKILLQSPRTKEKERREKVEATASWSMTVTKAATRLTSSLKSCTKMQTRIHRGL